MTRPNLVDEIEGAEGPSRELFLKAWRATWGDANCSITQCPEFREFGAFINVGAWTDAALLMLPEEMRDEIEISTLYRVAHVGINLNHSPDDGPYYGSNKCNSIPLALCAAALRARGEG